MLFLGVQLSIGQHWLGNVLVADRREIINFTADPALWHYMGSLGHNGLNSESPGPSMGINSLRPGDPYMCQWTHGDVIKWKHFPRYWPFVWGIHRSPVNSPHKGQWRKALMFTLICARINGWVNNREAGDLRRYRGHYDVIIMWVIICSCNGLPAVQRQVIT